MPISSVFQVVSEDPEQIESLVTTLNGYVTTTAASEAAAATSETNAATSETNAAASAASALTSKNAAANSAASASSDASAAATSATASQTAATSSSANAALTSADATQTAADRVQTGLDRIATAADAVQTAADRVQTGLDVTSSSASAAAALSSRNAAATSETNAAASAASSSADATATASDRVQTGLDAASTAADAIATAADRVQTGLDATSATNSASAASTSATAAAASQVSAASSAASAAAVFNDFEDRYYGPHASDSAAQTHVTGLGLTVDQGDLYFNSTANEMRVYDGGNWIAASSAGGASLINYNYTATASQTSFSGSDDNSNTLSYTVNNLIVTRNGVVLEDGTDYTATDGSTITLTVAAAVGDEINVVAFKSFTTADMVSATNGGTFQSNVTVNGTMTATAFSGDGSALTGINTDVVDDTTPQLGGDLSSNGNDINFGDNDKAIFGAGSDLQIYHDGSDSFIKDTGTGQLWIASDDYVGITNSAANEFKARFNTNGSVQLYYDNAEKLATTATGVDVTGVITTDGMTTSADINFGDNDKAVFGAGSDLQIYHDASDSYIVDGGTGNLRIQGEDIYLMNSAGTEVKIRADDDSFVKLYFDNAEKLATTSTGVDVTGTVTADGLDLGTTTGAKLTLYPTNYSLGVESNELRIASNAVTSFYSGGHSGTERMRLTADGRLGLGTNSPASGRILDADGQVRFQSSSSGRYFDFINDSAASYLDVSHALNIRTNGASSLLTAMTIDSSGRILCGTTDTDVFNNTSGNGINIKGISGAIEIAGADGEVLYLNRMGTDGRVVNFRKSGTYIGGIDVSTSGVTYNTTSDIRLKIDIEPIDHATDMLMAMNPVSHRWKADPDADAVVGFIAQEMQDIVPEAVSGSADSDEMMSMDYGRITPVLVAALQDAHNKIEQLEQRLADMENN